LAQIKCASPLFSKWIFKILYQGFIWGRGDISPSICWAMFLEMVKMLRKSIMALIGNRVTPLGLERD
jgi:hypothetical protein